jgi:hypothetical protein
VTIRDAPNMPRSVDVDTDRVVWKFRFEYQFHKPDDPWWQSTSELSPRPAPTTNHKDPIQEWQFTPYGPTVTFMSDEEYLEIDRGPGTDEGKADVKAQTFKCQTCKGRSVRPYALMVFCLNEECPKWDDIAYNISMSLGHCWQTLAHTRNRAAFILQRDMGGYSPTENRAKVSTHGPSAS